MLSLVLLVGPWYFITETHFFPLNSTCEVKRGSVIVPFSTELCGVLFKNIPNGNWSTMHALVLFYFVSGLFLQVLYKYDIYGVSKKIGLLLQLLLLFLY